MAESLSIPNLLGLLQVDPRHRGIQLARESDRLRRMQRYDEAVTVAQHAAQLARFDYRWQGVILLYHSYALLLSHRPLSEEQAIRECDRAIRGLSQAPFNQAIAHIIRALIELERSNSADLTRALEHFKQGAHLLGKAARAAQDYNDPQKVALYRELQRATETWVWQLLRQITQPADIKVAAKQDAPAAAPPEPEPEPAQPMAPEEQPAAPAQIDLPIHIIWPPPEPLSFEVASLGGLAAPELIAANELLIRGKRYRVDPIPAAGSSVSLQTNQPYLILPLQDPRLGQYVLVRQQSRPSAQRQWLALEDTVSQEAIIVETETDDQYQVMHIVGSDRTWAWHDGSSTDPYEPGSLIIIGAVEALLIPLD